MKFPAFIVVFTGLALSSLSYGETPEKLAAVTANRSSPSTGETHSPSPRLESEAARVHVSARAPLPLDHGPRAVTTPWLNQQRRLQHP